MYPVGIFLQSIPAINPLPPSPAHWLVYILRTKHNRLYTGITKDLPRRLRQHNGELAGGAKALRGKGPHQLVSLWQATDHSNALKYEAYIKSLRRQDKEQLISECTDSSEFNVEKIPTAAWPNLY